MKLANLVAKTDIFPLRSIYQAIYWRGIHSLMTLVKREKGVLGIYLTGSFLTGEHTHGISDVDLYFIVRGDCRQSKFEIRRHLTRCATYFPFLGPVEERVGKVFFADREDGLLNNPDLDYLWDTGYLKPLWEAPGFTYRPSTPRPARALSEIHKLLYFVLHRTREGLDPLSFWRSRIRVLKRLAEYVGHGLSLPPEVEALVEQPGGEVAGREDDELAELCLKTVVSSICEIKRTLGEGLVLDRTIRVSHHAPQEDSIPGAPEICETITEISRERLKDGCGPVMVKLPGFRVLLCYSVSIWHPLHSSTVCDLDRPWVFQPGKTEHRVNGELWDWQIDGILEKLKLQIEQLSAREPWLLGNDQRLMTGLLESKQLRAVSAVGMELYWSRESVVSALRQAFPDQKIFLDELERRCEELNEIEVDLEAGLWEREPTQVGAPNFFGHLVDFAENVARGTPPPPISNLEKRLSLSLCLITRDRASWLSALLETVAEQNRLPDEVVVVDNSPTRSAKEAVEPFRERLNLRYHALPDVSLGELRNRAVALSTGDIVCFTDDDCLLHPNWLLHVERNFLRDEFIGAMGGRVDHLSEQTGPLEEFHRLYLGDSKW